MHPLLIAVETAKTNIRKFITENDLFDMTPAQDRKYNRAFDAYSKAQFEARKAGLMTAEQCTSGFELQPFPA